MRCFRERAYMGKKWRRDEVKRRPEEKPRM
jgi:hypothetical protein